MTATQTAVRESLCRRILDMTDEEIEQVTHYLDELGAHECNCFQLHVNNSMRGKGRIKITTDEIMRLTRG